MSELKKQRVFQSQELKQQDVIESLNTQKLFNDNVTFIPQKTEDEEESDSSDIEMSLIKKENTLEY